ncbi:MULTISPECIES: hypothetical protein [unclassified Novosphingobium]|uniref:hypothetical protein n=1 Tax=unclassified Novosphingobium TaxID=2644732 RepID=UPI0025ED2012|nr:MULTISPECIES: hypothetical protein [unclassified Novosphingobium]HQV03279.1 hypothetical protein [Novosphingobium sp.]
MVAILALLGVCFAGLWLALVGLLCAASPARALQYLSRMGSTWPINLAELVPRGLIGLATVVHAPASKAPTEFFVVGCFLAVSALAILAVPRARHHAFAMAASQRIPAWTVRWLISPISITAGIVLIWAAL